MYIVIESGRDISLPARYISNSPAIARHNANVWNARSKASAIRFSEPSILGENSLNHVTIRAAACNSSVKSVLPLKHSILRDAINLKCKKIIT